VLNREWHLAHVLGRNASLDDRVAWHSEHVQVCRCRGMPASIRAEIERRDQTATRAVGDGDGDGPLPSSQSPLT
jgi:hypothetical protein